MGQSLVKNYVHIVFGTKHRTPIIREYIEQELHSYLVGICNHLECLSNNRRWIYRPYPYLMLTFQENNISKISPGN